jgi:hypothetical protein
MHMSFVGCIFKLETYPIGSASKWRIVSVVAGLTGPMDQRSTLDTSLCLVFKHAPSLLMTHEVQLAQRRTYT